MEKQGGVFFGVPPFMIWIVIAGIIGLAVYGLYRRAKRRVEHFARSAFGVSSLEKGLKAQAERLQETPKSVMAMTKVYLPQIIRDFPDFDWAQFQTEAENRIRGYLEKSGRYDIRIHQTEIAGYVKQDGICTVKIQSSAGYVKDAPERQDGKEKVQSRFYAELAYIQDAKKVKSGAAGISLTCPQCGAPVTKLGGKFCEYCGSGIVPVNIRVWTFQKVYEEEQEE